jgi:hypothetical protein
MRNKDEKTIVFEDAEIIFRNFEGREGRYNREGDRNFSVKIEDPHLVEKLKEDGWNVRPLKGREDEEPQEPAWHLPVSVGFKYSPPKMVLVTTKNKTVMPESLCGMFDLIDIQQADLVVRPYEWTVREDTGIKAYLKTLYIVQREDPLDLKYAEWGEEQPALEAGPDVTIIQGDWR